ncbi:MAG: hypothetical protein EOP48_35065 [Sphingobacteriales bacterium]|nr:MAG: hypothetical protein EOP48_35065 [Sphingobacteriales bacterium]
MWVKKNIPVLKLDSIPSNDELIGNLQNISFVLLDWRFENSVRLDGVRLPAHLEAFQAQENLDFIKKLLAVCFCPIFIFTNDNVDDIKALLTEAGLYFENKPNNIFLKSKGDLQRGNKLFLEVGSAC